MIVLACGSRGWADIHVIRRRLLALPPDATILHGAAPGADAIAAGLAEDFGFTVRAYPADWETYGKRAGVLRNLRMLDEQPDLVLAFQIGGSRGTQHVINEARERGIAVEVHWPDGPRKQAQA